MHIFIADYLPLKNKGEEEIIRGIQSLYEDKYNEKISFSIFGNVDSRTEVGDIVIYPQKGCYPNSGIRKRRSKLGVVKSLLTSFLVQSMSCMGISGISKRISECEGLKEDLIKADKILIAHDGFYNYRCNLMGDYLQRNNLHYAILGAGFNPPPQKIKWIQDIFNKRFFNNADFIILREQTAYEYVKKISNNKCVRLLPDPAFFCPAAGVSTFLTEKIISDFELNNKDYLKIGVTICENSISFSTSFRNHPNKVFIHRQFITSLVDNLLEKYDNARIYFLPHCIEQGLGNDLVIAEEIIKLSKYKNKLNIIYNDISVLELKQIISKMDFIIGERTHSIINSISCNIPFVNLTCSADFRTHDIVEHFCGLGKYVIDLDCPNEKLLQKELITMVDNRTEECAHIEEVTKKNIEYKKEVISII